MTSTTDRATSVHAIAEHYVEDSAAGDPLLATFVGVSGYDHLLPDLTPAGFDGREEQARAAYTAMEAAEPTDQGEHAARSAFLERLDVHLDQCDAHRPQTQISVLTSWLHAIRSVFDLMDTSTPEQWDAVSSRLAAIPGALADYRGTLLHEADLGHVSPGAQLVKVADQLRRYAGEAGANGDFFTGLVAAAEVPGPTSARLQAGAQSARAAYSDFATFLDTELAPRGRDKEAVGREQYVRDSRYFLGATIDLDETYAWGWEELHRIETDMGAIARGLAPGAPSATGRPADVAAANAAAVAAAVEVLDADPSMRIHGAERFRDWMQELSDRTVAEMADTHFDIPDQIRRLECRLAPTHDGGIYYTGPTEDFSRPGRMWWSVPEGVEDFSTWREVTTVYHEGVPGHHLQVAQTQLRRDLLDRWQRLMCWVSGHGEGWALYAERLMDDLGYFPDPGSKLGMLDMQGFRAGRVIVDIGMHLELPIPRDNPFGFHPGETWTPELGLEFMRQHSRMNDAMIVFEVDRYLGWPGQAPSYKVGERIWLQAREDLRRRQGAAFDLKSFHRAALDLGSLGLDPLQEALARL